MSYRCKRPGCGKIAATRSGLRCFRCYETEAAARDLTPIYSTPPSYSESRDIGYSTSGDSDTFRSGGGGDFGGGGSSGGWDSGSSDSGSSSSDSGSSSGTD